MTFKWVSKKFEIEIFLEIFHINLDIIIFQKFQILKYFCENIPKNIPPKIVP
jgi:hypothetical protein